MIIERVGRKPLLLWCSAVEIVSMVIIGGLASGPQIAPTVPPKAYGEAAIAFIVGPPSPSSCPAGAEGRSASTCSRSTCRGGPSLGAWPPNSGTSILHSLREREMLMNLQRRSEPLGHHGHQHRRVLDRGVGGDVHAAVLVRRTGRCRPRSQNRVYLLGRLPPRRAVCVVVYVGLRSHL
jgi:hypothetical protein